MRGLYADEAAFLEGVRGEQVSDDYVCLTLFGWDIVLQLVY